MPDEGQTKAQLVAEIQELRRELGHCQQELNSLRESRQVLEALLEYLPEGIVIAAAPDLAIKTINRVGQRLAGRARDALLGKPVDRRLQKWRIFRGDGAAPLAEAELPLVRAATNGEAVLNEELVLQWPDGDRAFLKCNAGPIVDEQGRIAGGVLAWRDITERKRLEAERQILLEQEQGISEELRLANESLQVQAQELELQAEELIRAREQETALAEEMQAQNEELQAQAEEMEVQKEELRQAADDLEAQKQLLEVVIRQMPGGVIIADAPQGKIMLINDRFEHIWGHPARPADGIEHYSQYKGFHPDGRAYWLDEWPLARSIKQGEVVSEEEIEFLRADGTRGVMSVSSAPVLDQQKKIVAGVSISFDITNRKEAEREIQRMASFPRLNPNPVLEIDPSGAITFCNQATLATLQRLDPDLGPEAFFPADLAEIQTAARQTGARSFYREVRIKDATFALGVSYAAPFDVLRLYAMDISPVKQAELHLQRQNAILDGINRVFREALACETEEELGRTCLAMAEELTGSKFGFLGEINPEGRLDDLAISDPGWEACKVPGSEELVLPKGLHMHGIYGTCLREGRAEIANDPARHPERIGLPPGHPPLTAFLGVPLKHGGKTIGMIGLGNKPGGYADADREAVEALSVAVVEAFRRWRAEAAVRRAKGEWERTFDAVPDLVAILDDRHRIVRVNRAMAQALGTTPADLVGRPCHEIMHRHAAPPAFCPHSRLLADGLEHSAEVHELDRDFLVTASPLADGQGRVMGSVHVARDITARKQAEAALKASEALYRSLFENMLNGFAYCRMLFEQNEPQDFIYLNVNQSFEALTGLQNVIGKKVSEVIPGIRESDPELLKLYGRVALTGEPETAEIYVEALKMWFAISVYSPEKEHFVAVFDVITARKEAEAALQQAHGKLEERVKARTAELRRTVDQLSEEVAERLRAEQSLKVSHHFLEIMNRHNDLDSMLRELVTEIKNLTQCAAVGVRLLEEGNKIPYLAYVGFTKEFYESESPLTPADHCMCINVINGTTDPRLPFYTPGGSFYMNGTTRFLATVSEADKGQSRNVCNAAGFESVALVPIRQGDQLLGLIHLADAREDLVPLEKVELVEWIGLQLGAALQRVKSEAAVRNQAQLLNLAHDAIIVRNLDARVTFWNQGAEETYGVSMEHALGHRTDSLLRTQFSTSREEVDWEILQNGQWQGELLHTRADGAQIVIASRQVLQRDAQGKPAAILEINRDITYRKKAEADLRRQGAIMEGINRILLGVHTSGSEEELGRTSLAVVEELTGAGFGMIYELNPAGLLDGVAISAAGWSACRVPGAGEPALPKHLKVRGLYSSIVRDGKPLMTNEPSAHPDRIGVPKGHPELTAFLGLPLRLEGQVIGLLGLGNKAGGFDLADQEIAETLSVAVVEALMRFRVEKQALTISRLYRILSQVNEAIVRAPDRETLFQEACRILVEEGLFRLAWIGLLDPADKTIKVVEKCGFEEGYLESLVIPMADVPEGRGPTGTAVREGRIDICNDYATDLRMAPWREQALARGYRSSAALPLRVGAEVVGALTLYAETPGFFTQEEISLLEGMAGDLSFALESMDREARRRQAVEALQESEERLRFLSSQLMSAQEQERKRISLELHDDLGQSLTVLKLQLRGLESTLPADLPELKERNTQIRDYLNDVIEKVRRISRDLSPAVLEDLGLQAAVRYLCEELNKQGGLTCALEMDDIKGLLPLDQEINIYRIFQESLNNIIKHAGADQIGIAIKKHKGCVAFRVEDNGSGFHLQDILSGDPAQRGLGLAAMDERVRILGGNLHIWSRPGQGTKLSFTIPAPETTASG